MLRRRLPLLLLLATSASSAGAAAPARPDKQASAWVKKTLAKMTLDEKVGQLVLPGLNGVYTPADSDAFDKLERLVREGRVGGFHVFGGSETLPAALLNPVYGTSGGRAIKGEALAIATLLNRLQRASALPLLFSADFEGGAGYIVDGATRLPRAMALGATRDSDLAERGGAPGGERRPGARRARGLLPGGRRQREPAEPDHQRTLVRRGPRARGADGDRLHARHPAGRHARDRQALPRPRRHVDRHAPRPRRRRPPARAARRRGARAVPRDDRSRHRRRHDLAHPAAGARPDRGPARDAQPTDPDRPAAPGARLRGARVHRLAVDARDQQALHPGAGCRAGGRGRSRRGARPARSRGGAARHPAGGRARPDPARAARPLGRAHPGREGAPRPPAHPQRGRRGGAGERRRPGARGGGGRDRLARDHAHQGRARARPAAAAAERAGAAAVGNRLGERLARGRSGAGADPGAQEAPARPRPRSR